MKFYSIRQALEYQAYCPVCDSPMRIDDRYAEAKTNWQGDKQTTKLCWRSEDNEEMIIDPDSSYVEFVDKYFRPEYITGTMSAITSLPKKKVYDGHLYERIGLTCDDCCKYNYLVKFVIDVGMKMISEIELNSETISIEDKGIVHEIKNKYSVRETRYTYFPSRTGKGMDGTFAIDGCINLPLIPLDVKNPNKTLERIRTLVLFS